MHDRHHIRVFFPGLKGIQRESSALTAEESAIVYSHGIYPATKQVAPSICHNFPPSYGCEVFRSTLRNGAQIQSTYPLTYNDIHPFSTAFRECMSRLPWGKDIVYCTEIRGVKNWSEHLLEDSEENEENPQNAENAENALYNLFRTFSWGGHNVEEGDWYVDVALEILLQDKAVVWRADCYRQIMRELLDFSEEEVNRTTSNKRLFELDLSQHLTQVAGFRARCKQETGTYEVLYIQAYTTDKALTYQPEAGNFGKTLSAKSAMEGGGEGPSYTTRLLRSYEEAREKTDVAARLEVRVPLRHAARVLLKFPRELYRHTALVFPRELWW